MFADRFHKTLLLYFYIIVYGKALVLYLFISSLIIVYVFVGEHIALIDFIKCLQRRKLLDTGDYVVISVDDEIYDPNRRIELTHRSK